MKITRTKIKSFIEGNLRKFLLSYSWTKKLVPLHIREQIEWRIRIMDQRCFLNGACLMCGCSTPGLQMANDACEKPCYPDMMDKMDWKDTKHRQYHSIMFHGRLKVFPYAE